MKLRLFLLILFLVVLVFAAVGFNRFGQADLKNARYMGTCFLCKCLCALPGDQVALVRNGRQPICFICPRCLKVKMRSLK